MIAERLARGGCAWANLRVTVPLDVALAMAAPWLVARGIDPVAESLGPALIMRLMLDLPAGVPRYFRPAAGEPGAAPSADQPRMAESLWRTIRALRLAGATAAALPVSAFGIAAKHAELRALLAAYEGHLAANRLADAADVYREALAHPETCPVGSEDLRLELAGVAWAPLERRLLDALPGTALAARTLALPGLEMPRTVATYGGRTDAVPPAPRSDAERLVFTMEPALATPPLGDGTLDLFRAAGREAEIEEVLRRVLGGERRLDDVEIACASADDAALVWDKASRLGLPVTMAAGVPAARTRPARALLAFLSWAAERFPASALRRLFQSGDVTLGFDDDDGPSAGQAARLLARSAATWERHTYEAALGALVDDLLQRAADPEEDAEAAAAHRARAAQAQRLAKAIKRLLRLVPKPGAGGLVPVARLVEGCRGFLATSAVVTGDVDGAARAALDRTLADLLVLGDLGLPLRDAVRLIGDRVAAIAVGASRASPGHLHVTPLAAAGHAGRPYVFVVGLDEGGVFPAALEDPILLDDERERLREAAGIDLPTSRERMTETLWATVGRLAALGGHVCLSHSCRNLREGRETFPSWLLLQAHRLRAGKPDATYEDLRNALRQAVTAIPPTLDRALDDSRWWLAALDRTGRTGVPAIDAAFPVLARGRAAEAARTSSAFTPWDGFVAAAAARLDPRSSGEPISATGLEKLAGCPFRYFLERGLGLKPLEDKAPDPDLWLDSRTRGTLMHELFAAILRELRARGEAPDPARHGEWARTLAREKLAELRRRIPAPAEHVHDREVAGVLRDVDLFLRSEAAEPGRRPVGFEVSFGNGPADAEPLAQAEPVRVDLGSGLRFELRGRIDRIDRLPEGYEVVDYKTGGPFLTGGTEGVHFAGGRQLQHALYALAAEQLLRRTDPAARVVSSSYYFPSDRGGGERVPRPATPPSTLAAVMSDLFGVAAAGAFVHTADDEDCKFCELEGACGASAAKRAKGKLDDAANTVLAAFGRLRKHA
jgi:ATP-dependent helicase/nuclease subunit B